MCSISSGALIRTQPVRPDQGAGDEIAEHRAEAEAAEDHDEGQGRAEHDDAVAKDEGGGVRGGFGWRHQLFRSQPAAARAAAAAASKASRIEGWRAE
jgi:hypothetical protein